jgi:hypothetical protein
MKRYSRKLEGLPLSGSKCKIEGCNKSIKTRRSGLCTAHYALWKRYGDPLIRQNRPILPCPVEGCSKLRRRKRDDDYCAIHHTHNENWGHPTKKTVCLVDDCLSDAAHPSSRGWCEFHYDRWKTYGNPLAIPPKVDHPPKCSIKGCNRRYFAKGLCQSHYRKQHHAKTINARIAHNLRARLAKAVKDPPKRGSFVRDLGCSISEFRDYIAKLFTAGMSWDNYGEWEFDHILPLSRVDLSDREQFLIVANYTNYQPLWSKENSSKGNRI